MQPEHSVETPASQTEASVINIHEGVQRRDWAARLNTTQLRIVEAVKNVGPLAADVRRFVGQDPALHAADQVTAGRR